MAGPACQQVTGAGSGESTSTATGNKAKAANWKEGVSGNSQS